MCSPGQQKILERKVQSKDTVNMKCLNIVLEHEAVFWVQDRISVSRVVGFQCLQIRSNSFRLTLELTGNLYTLMGVTFY